MHKYVTQFGHRRDRRKCDKGCFKGLKKYITVNEETLKQYIQLQFILGYNVKVFMIIDGCLSTTY